MITPVEKGRLLALADFLEDHIAPLEVNGRRVLRMEIWSNVSRHMMKPLLYLLGEEPEDENKCGTAACALGWATVRFHGDLRLSTIAPVNPKPLTRAGSGPAGNFFGVPEGTSGWDYLFGPVHGRRTALQEAAILREYAEEHCEGLAVMPPPYIPPAYMDEPIE